MKKAISLIIAIFLLLYCGLSYASGTVHYNYIEAQFTYIVGETINQTRNFSGNANSEGYLNPPSTSASPSPVVSDFSWVYNEISNSKATYSIYDTNPHIYRRSGTITIFGKAASVGTTSIRFSASGSFHVLHYDCVVNCPVFTIKVIDNSYSINLNANGGFCENTSHSVIYNFPYSQQGNLPIPTREGYNFLGWYTDKTGGTQVTDETVFSNRSAMIIRSTVTLYAHWAPITYEVNYYGDANGVTNVPDAQIKVWGEALSITSTVPEREGYAFRGWGTDPYNSAVSFQPGDYYQENAPINLYAKWLLKTYTVAFDGNGENVTNIPLAESKIHGMDINIPDNVPVRENAMFMGWSTAADSETAEYQPGDTFSLDEDTTLYVVWDTNICVVAYDANGGSGAPATQKKSQKQSLLLSSAIPTREGYSFRGWAKSAGATEAAYQPGEEFNENTDTTLYAIWTPSVYTVTYQANGGSDAPADQSKTYGQELILSENIPTRKGFVFLGWAETEMAADAAYQPGGSFTQNTDSTLYAVWLAPDFVLPASLKQINDEAFVGDTFRYVKLPEAVTTIGNKAFANCPKLEYIYIPEATTNIDRYAFDCVESLTIIGVLDSYAEFYANRNGFGFQVLAIGN